MLRVIASSDADYESRIEALAGRAGAMPPAIEAAAREIIVAVRARGDDAVRELTAKHDRRAIGALEIGRAGWKEMAASAPPRLVESLERAAIRIRAFHRRESYESFEILEGGARVGSRVDPLARVGIYVPGGTATYPSTVLMTAIPAKVAGVREIVMTTPGPSPAALAAARIAGVDRVFAIGGAQAIAALAYGTESVPRVDKIVGPGNAYVAAAKRLVFGDVGIDSIAGPTEVVVVADDSADPAWLAADLLAQAEHDALAAPILVALGRPVADAVSAEVARQIATLPRREIAEKAVRGQGAAIVVSSLDEALAVTNRLAPEHVELCVRGARDVAARITAAGAIFIGLFSPEPVGDYLAGPSHVLPTAGSARFASPLGVSDFVKRTSIIEYERDALLDQADDIERLAQAEGLDAHARSVAIRRRA